MIRTLLLSTLLIHSISVSAQYCMSGGPSSEIDSNLEWLTLNGASGSINFTGCSGPTQGVLGVEEYLTQTAFLNAGGNYTVNLQFGTCGNNFSGVGEAWIDFNLDGTFDASESIGTWQGTPPTAASAFNFTVPGGASNGQSRMRVMHYESGTLPLNPCASFTWGSVTDFSVYIQNGIDCSGYTGDDWSDPRIISSLPFNENHNSATCYTNQNTVYNSPDVFYLIEVPSNTAALNISLCGSSFDTFLSVARPDGTVIAINDDHPDCGTSSKLTVSTEGEDSLFIIVDGWSNESGDYVISIDGETLNVEELESSVSLSPNPFSNELVINQFDGDVQIISSSGEVVLETSVSGSLSLTTSHLRNGVYFVKFKSDKGSITKKVVKL